MRIILYNLEGNCLEDSWVLLKFNFKYTNFLCFKNHAVSDSNLHSCTTSCTKQVEQDMCQWLFFNSHERWSWRCGVRLPFKNAKPQFNLDIRKLHCSNIHGTQIYSDSRFYQLYHDCIDEYLSLGHMSEWHL